MSSIATNMGSIIAQNNLAHSQKAMQTSLQKLSSGFRINSAADDAAGLAISEKMRAQISGLNTASNNAQKAISLMQSAEGAMAQSTSILQRMRELAVQSASDTNTGFDRVAIQSEVDGLASEISRISNTTEFNTQNLLAGGMNSKFQIGANQGQNVGMSIGAMDAQTLGVAGKLNIKSGVTTVVGLGVGAATALGDGLTAQQYGLRTTVFSGTSGANAINSSSTGYAGTTGFYSGQYSGQVDTTYKIRVDSVTNVSLGSGAMVSVSTDGGVTYGASQAYVSGSFNLGNGMGYVASGGAAVAGDVMSATFKAYTASFQLLDATSGAVGTAVVVNNLATSATVGDSSTLQTMDVKFLAANIASALSGVTAASGVFQAIGQTVSTAATTSNGVVTQAATVLRGIDVSSALTAGKAITAIDKALATVSASRANMGALQNRLTYTMNNLNAAATNLKAAESAIRDTDMAAEMSAFTKNQILTQAGVSMLAQANQDPQTVLKLLQ